MIFGAKIHVSRHCSTNRTPRRKELRCQCAWQRAGRQSAWQRSRQCDRARPLGSACVLAEAREHAPSALEYSSVLPRALQVSAGIWRRKQLNRPSICFISRSKPASALARASVLEAVSNSAEKEVCRLAWNTVNAL